MDRKIRIGAVSYLNTKPLLYGIQRSALMEDIELVIDYPSRIATMLLDDEIDMGLVPVAILPKMRKYYINGNYCIGSDGAVSSVCLFSDIPLEEVNRVLLDYQSRTSVQLAKVLLREYWKVSPELVDARENFQDQIKGRTAGLIIGDRALEQRKRSKYVYDLGEAWKALTGLPFVFAAWISNKELDGEFIKAFDLCNGLGVNDLQPVLAGLDYPHFDLTRYYTQCISYNLDEAKKKGLRLFLQKIQTNQPAGAEKK